MTATPAKLLLLLACLPIAALAKLPTPELSPEEQARAAEVQAKAAYQARLEVYQTCLASERVAAHYFKTHPEAPKPAAAPACTDPVPFVAAAPASSPVVEATAHSPANATATSPAVAAPEQRAKKP